MRRRILELWGAVPIPQRLRWWMVQLGVTRFPIGLVAVITNEERKLLFFKHTYRGRYPWGLPTGWLEAGEAPEAGITREIFEETGLRVDNVRPLLVRSATEFRRIDLAFRCRLAGGDFRPSSEVVELAWFGRSDLPRLMRSQYVMIAEIFAALEKEENVRL